VPQTAANVPPSAPSSASGPAHGDAQSTRGLATSARAAALNPGPGTPSADPEQMVGGEQPGHTAEAYAKGNDGTPASGDKHHVVDSSSSSLDAPGLAPHQGAPKHEPPAAQSGAHVQGGDVGAAGRLGLHTSAVARPGQSAGEIFSDVAGTGGQKAEAGLATRSTTPRPRPRRTSSQPSACTYG
jgi:hypothetical protein